MKKKFLCKIGMHAYTYNYVGGKNADGEALNGSLRHCTDCGKTQTLDVHCLGLNPPAYDMKWLNTVKHTEKQLEKFTPKTLKNGNPNNISAFEICTACEHHFIYSTADTRYCDICINKKNKVTL